MNAANRRDFLRANIALHARCHVLNEEELEILHKGMGSTLLRSGYPSILDEFIGDMTPESKDEPLFRCFQMINNKLDFIIDQVFYSDKPGQAYPEKVTEISGSGLKFLSSKSISPGELIKMDVILPESLRFRLVFIGEVVRVEGRQDESERKNLVHLIAVKFVEIDEESRDSIIKTVFKRQRQLIRREKAIKKS